MPVLELLALRLRPGLSITDPTLLHNMSTVRSLVKTNSRFFANIHTEPVLIWIIGEWPSLAAHKEFLSSPSKDAILAHQTHQLDFNWMLHIESRTEDVPRGLEVTFWVVERTRWSERDKDMEDIVSMYHRHMKGSAPGSAVGGWRIDAAQGEEEYVMVSGWHSEAEYQMYRARYEVGDETPPALTRVQNMYGVDMETEPFRQLAGGNSKNLSVFWNVAAVSR